MPEIRLARTDSRDPEALALAAELSDFLTAVYPEDVDDPLILNSLAEDTTNAPGVSFVPRADIHRNPHYYSSYYRKEYARYYVK